MWIDYMGSQREISEIVSQIDDDCLLLSQSGDQVFLSSTIYPVQVFFLTPLQDISKILMVPG